MSKRKEEVKQLKEKTHDELAVLGREIERQIDGDRVQSYFGDQAKVNNVKGMRKKLARINTIMTELENDKTKKEAK